MVAPSYAERRSTLAKSIGLGRKPKAVAEREETPEVPGEQHVRPIPKTRNRKLAKAESSKD